MDPLTGDEPSNFSLDSITTGKKVRPYTALLYGVPGVGKTTFAAGLKDPVFIFTEPGQGLLSVSAFPDVTDYGDLDGALLALLGEHHYRTLVIDSLTALESIIIESVCREGGKKSIGDFAYGKGWTRVTTMWEQLLRRLDQLRNKRGMNIVLIGHAIVKKFEDPLQVDAFDQYRINIRREESREIIAAWVENILFANFRVTVVEKDGKNRAVGSSSRILYTEQCPAFIAKNRYGLPRELPLDPEAFRACLNESLSKKDSE